MANFRFPSLPSHSPSSIKLPLDNNTGKESVSASILTLSKVAMLSGLLVMEQILQANANDDEDDKFVGEKKETSNVAHLSG